MHPHLEARGRSFPAASRPNHRFPPSSLDGPCCDGSRSACGYARPCLAPFALQERRHVLVFALDFSRFSPGFFFFSVYVFRMFFFGTFAQEAAKRPSLINNFSSAIYWIRARIALLSFAQSQPKGKARIMFHIQFKTFPPIEQNTNISIKQ